MPGERHYIRSCSDLMGNYSASNYMSTRDWKVDGGAFHSSCVISNSSRPSCASPFTDFWTFFKTPGLKGSCNPIVQHWWAKSASFSCKTAKLAAVRIVTDIMLLCSQIKPKTNLQAHLLQSQEESLVMCVLSRSRHDLIMQEWTKLHFKTKACYTT